MFCVFLTFHSHLCEKKACQIQCPRSTLPAMRRIYASCTLSACRHALLWRGRAESASVACSATTMVEVEAELQRACVLIISVDAMQLILQIGVIKVEPGQSCKDCSVAPTLTWACLDSPCEGHASQFHSHGRGLTKDSHAVCVQVPVSG